MQPQFQNGTYYSPGSKVFSFFIINRVAPVVLFVIGVGILLVILKNIISGAKSAMTLFPFDPKLLISIGLPVVIGAGALVALIAVASAWMDYKNTQFMLDDVAFHIVRGIFSKSEIAIPYRQIQNVSHEQSFNEKMWGIAHVIIETAGTDSVRSSESDGVLPVLDADLASALETELLRRGSVK